MRWVSSLLSLGFLLAACSGATAVVSGDGGADCGPPPPLPCAGCCGGTPQAPVCQHGAWSCEVCTVECVVDAGRDADGADSADAGCGPQPALECPGCCNGPARPPVCADGSWKCPVCTALCIVDGGRDASGDGGAPCGDKTCDPKTEYCSAVSAGAPSTKAGGGRSYSCPPLPAACHGVATCACVEGDAGAPACTCASDGAGTVTVTCSYP